ncbi:MAG: hypothetical protein Q4Q53_05445 [Methanocorpusculum sp.]|nr:hypothetical protein [Methanocorpusculum sp.]
MRQIPFTATLSPIFKSEKITSPCMVILPFLISDTVPVSSTIPVNVSYAPQLIFDVVTYLRCRHK